MPGKLLLNVNDPNVVRIDVENGVAYVQVKRLADPWKAPEWQPIETAPKDGTFVLLGGGKPCDMHWAENPASIVVAQFENDRHGGRWIMSHFDSDCASIEYDDPTHWMPLPNPPAPSA